LNFHVNIFVHPLLSAIMDKLVGSSRAAIRQISTQDQQAVLSNRVERISGDDD
jgi:hypothetical protein